MSVTGKHELKVKFLQEKFGSIFLSTKGCASGTCEKHQRQNVSHAESIPDTFDRGDPSTIALKHGYLY